MSMPTTKMMKWVFSQLLLLFLFLQSNHGFSRNIVKHLPGFPAELPFILETGYISINESEIFYTFVESQGDPRKDPLILYLIGGPGCSGLQGFFYQSGPLHFDIINYSGGFPNLSLYPYDWTKFASIIFLDQPAGTGYSYSTNWESLIESDTQSSNLIYVFLKKWLREHPEFSSNPFLLASDSYGGVHAAMVAEQILSGNEESVDPPIPLQGIVSGSPYIDPATHNNSKVPYYYHMALISDTLYKAAKSSCNGKYIDVSPSNLACSEHLKAIDTCVGRINSEYILGSYCKKFSHLTENPETNSLISCNERDRDCVCKAARDQVMYIWANHESVKQALHVRNGTVQNWISCNHTIAHHFYNKDVTQSTGSIIYHRNLTATRLQLLIYVGDHEITVTYSSTIKWIQNMNVTLEEDWRPWVIDNEIVGYTMKFSNMEYQLTFATLKGSGHSPTQYYGRNCYEMFQRWYKFRTL